MVKVKITRNYQLTIPAQIRAKLGLKEGEIVEVNLDREGRILIERVSGRRRTLKAGRKPLPDEIEGLIEKGLMETMK